MYLRVMMTVGTFSMKTRNNTMPTRTRKRGSVWHSVAHMPFSAVPLPRDKTLALDW